MKVVHLVAPGSGPVLVDAPTPSPGPGEVSVRIRACSLNFRDIMISRGQYGGPTPYPLVPLSDGAGTIEFIGEGVTGWNPGDRVAGCFFPYWASGPVTPETDLRALGAGGGLTGMLSEFVILPACGIVPIPEEWSFEEAATLPCAALTAWNALFETGSFRPGETLLVLGTGGVSTFAAGFAKKAGGSVIVVSRSEEKLATLLALGADHGLCQEENSDWTERVLEVTGGRGVDQVIEVGGGHTLSHSLKATRTGGRVSVIGGLSGWTGEITLGPIVTKALTVSGVYVGNRDNFIRMLRMLRTTGMKPHISARFSLEETGLAFSLLEKGSHTGKIVISLP